MTDEPTDPRDEALLAALAAAFTEDGDLPPTDEAAVARAELDGVEDVELPPGLEGPRGRPGEVVDLGERRRRARASFATHAATALLGAAAAAILILKVPPRGPETAPNADPAGVPPRPAPIALTLPACGECCAGAACKSSSEGLAQCPSGRTCVACKRAVLAESRYRLRLGAVSPAEVGRQAIEAFPGGKLEICARAGASREVCVPAHTDATGDVWTALPLVVSGQDLAARLALDLRWQGVTGKLRTPARWLRAVPLSATALCLGHLVRFETAEGEPFATMSLFLDDAHYVELSRAAAPAALREHHARLKLDNVRVQIHETRQPGDQAFVLTVGPVDRPAAERLRWQLLEQKQKADTSVGTDYIGEPLPL